jgi:hypothetical protein
MGKVGHGPGALEVARSQVLGRLLEVKPRVQLSSSCQLGRKCPLKDLRILRFCELDQELDMVGGHPVSNRAGHNTALLEPFPYFREPQHEVVIMYTDIDRVHGSFPAFLHRLRKKISH